MIASLKNFYSKRIQSDSKGVASESPVLGVPEHFRVRRGVTLGGGVISPPLSIPSARTLQLASQLKEVDGGLNVSLPVSLLSKLNYLSSVLSPDCKSSDFSGELNMFPSDSRWHRAMFSGAEKGKMLFEKFMRYCAKIHGVENLKFLVAAFELKLEGFIGRESLERMATRAREIYDVYVRNDAEDAGLVFLGDDFAVADGGSPVNLNSENIIKIKESLGNLERCPAKENLKQFLLALQRGEVEIIEMMSGDVYRPLSCQDSEVFGLIAED